MAWGEGDHRLIDLLLKKGVMAPEQFPASADPDGPGERVVASEPVALALVRLSDNMVVYANPAWDALYRRAAGAPLGDVVARIDRDRHPDVFGPPPGTTEGASRFGWAQELSCIRYDGTRFRADTMATALSHPLYGEVLACVQAEITAARPSRELAERIFGSALDLLAVADHDTNLQRVNPAWERTFGWRHDDIGGVPLEAWAHPDDRDRVRAALAGATHDPVQGLEGRWRCADGTYRWLQVNTVATQDPPLVVIVARDITDQRNQAHESAVLLAAKSRMEAELRESEARYRSIFDNAPVGVVTTSMADGTFLDVNEAFCRLTGLGRADVVGATAYDLFASADLEQGDRVTADALSRGAPVTYENHWQGPDGRMRDLRSITAVVTTRREPAYTLTLVEDVTERKRLERELERRALYDDLTSLANRALFLDRLAQALERSRRTPTGVAVLYIDVDHFKDLNDSLGHHIGDRILTEIGRRLRQEVRAADTAARLASDEFALLCPDVATEADVAEVAARVHRRLSRPMRVEGCDLIIGTSIGVAVTDSRAATVDELMHAVDAALHHAKRRGRNRWELYTDALAHASRHRHETEQLLRDALDRHLFCLHYQPVVEIATRRIVGVEALLRIQHPSRGLIPPSAFIDLAEESDIIVPIGEWVISQACRRAAEWNRHRGPVEVAVNLSARQLAHPNLVTHLRTTLEEAGADPRCLCLKLTERVLIDATPTTVDDLTALHEDGIRLALDDFGTGYSSLLQLKRFPITTIKIDRNFITELRTRPDDLAIIHAITTLAADLELTTIAEGIETPEQLDLLQTLGCQHAQGFLLHLPQPDDAITELLAASSAG